MRSGERGVTSRKRIPERWLQLLEVRLWGGSWVQIGNNSLQQKLPKTSRSDTALPAPTLSLMTAIRIKSYAALGDLQNCESILQLERLITSGFRKVFRLLSENCPCIPINQTPTSRTFFSYVLGRMMD